VHHLARRLPEPILRRTDRAASTFVQEVEHGGGVDRRQTASRVATTAGSYDDGASRPDARVSNCACRRLSTCNIPTQLTLALGPDILLFLGTMALMLWAAWRPDSREHQRNVGRASLVLVLATMAAVIGYQVAHVTAGPGVIAVDAFRWASDLIFLTATLRHDRAEHRLQRARGYRRRRVPRDGPVCDVGMMLLAAAATS